MILPLIGPLPVSSQILAIRSARGRRTREASNLSVCGKHYFSGILVSGARPNCSRLWLSNQGERIIFGGVGVEAIFPEGVESVAQQEGAEVKHASGTGLGPKHA